MPAGGDRLARRGARAALRRHAPVLRGAAVSGDPFEPDLAAAAAGVSDAVAMDAFDELLDARLGPRDRRPAAVPLPAPARAPRGVRERARRLAARRPRALRGGARRRAARRRWRVRITSSTPRATGISTPSPCSRRPGRARCSRAPASAARWFSAALRLMPESAPARAARRAAARPCPRARRARAGSPRATPTCSSASRSPRRTRSGLRVQLTTTCAGVERLLGRHDEAHARLLREPRPSCRTRRRRRDRADDRARDRRAVARGAGGGLRLGGARAGGRARARRRAR